MQHLTFDVRGASDKRPPFFVVRTASIALVASVAIVPSIIQFHDEQAPVISRCEMLTLKRLQVLCCVFSADLELAHDT